MSAPTIEGYTSVEWLAKQMQITPEAVLYRADAVIDQMFKTGGLAAIAGLSYRYPQVGGMTYTFVTDKLAAMITRKDVQ